jgi:hypothetical protein
VAVQNIATNGATSWDSFTINGEQYLAVANHQNDISGQINSVIYKWNGSSLPLQTYISQQTQSLATIPGTRNCERSATVQPK